MQPNKTPSMFPLLVLSLTTSPFIFSILLLYALGECLQGIGKLSEELFRAEQLPLLHFPKDIAGDI